MNPKSTRLLVFLALGLFLYIYRYEIDPTRPTNNPANNPDVLADFDPDSVTSLDFVFAGNPTNRFLQVDRTNGAWRMTSPVLYPVREASVHGLLAALKGLQKRQTISAAELLRNPRGTTAFGLEPPPLTIGIRAATGRTELRIGNRAPLGDLFYLQVLGSQDIHVAEADFLKSLPRTPNDWRSRSIVDLRGVAFDRLEVRSAAAGFEVRRHESNRTWTLTKPLAIRANRAKIESLLQVLQSVEVEEFVGTQTTADLERLGLLPPRLEAVFGRGTNDLFSLRLGLAPTNQPGLVYARMPVYSNVVTVARGAFDLLSLSYSALVDPQLLVFPTGAVDRIEIRSAEHFTLERQTNSLWRIGPPVDRPADHSLVQELFERLLRLEIVEVEKDVVTELDFDKYGLGTNAPQFSLFATQTGAANIATQTVVARVTFGTNDAQRILARRDGDTPVFRLRLADFQGLPRRAFEFRERRLWNFTTNQVASLTLRVGGQTRRFARAPDGAWSFAAGGPGPIPLALDEALLRLGSLQAEGWVAEGTEKLSLVGIPELDHSLQIEINSDTGPQVLTLRFGARSPTLAPYAAVTLPGETQPLLFQFTYWYYDPYQSVLRELKLAQAAGTP